MQLAGCCQQEEEEEEEGPRLHAEEALALAALPDLRNPGENGVRVRVHEVAHALHDARDQRKHQHLHAYAPCISRMGGPPGVGSVHAFGSSAGECYLSSRGDLYQQLQAHHQQAACACACVDVLTHCS